MKSVRPKPSVSRNLGLVLALSAGFLTLAPFNEAAAEEVEASLVLPDRPLQVVGDPIELNWRFTNKGSEPLAFLWEGCCRMNGRLTVTRDSENVPPNPPGVAIAHMYAKAEILEPGLHQNFSTRLWDWFSTTQGGTYELSGRYVGILPHQRPFVRGSVQLWRSAAETDPVRIRLHSIKEYLEMRSDLEGKAGLEMQLKGPDRIFPTQTATWRLALSRRPGSSPIQLEWPGDFRIWWVDQQGARLSGPSPFLQTDYQKISLAPGQTHETEWSIQANELLGTSAGSLKVFIDWNAPTPPGRLPSTSVSTQWKWDIEASRALILACTEGETRGSRNTYLVMARTHMEDLAPHLPKIAFESQQASHLARELVVAAAWKKIAPKPGSLVVHLLLEKSGIRLKEPPMPEAQRDWKADLTGLMDARRHGGWTPSFLLEVAEDLTLQELAQAWEQVIRTVPDAADSLSVLLGQRKGELPIELKLQPAVRTAASLKVQQSQGVWEILKESQPTAGLRGALQSPENLPLGILKEWVITRLAGGQTWFWQPH